MEDKSYIVLFARGTALEEQKKFLDQIEKEGVCVKKRWVYICAFAVQVMPEQLQTIRQCRLVTQVNIMEEEDKQASLAKLAYIDNIEQRMKEMFEKGPDDRLEPILADISSLTEVDENKAYRTYDVVQKNVLLLGKSGTGKSTLFQVLRDPQYRGNAAGSLFAKTIHAEYHPLVVFDPISDKYYSINLIDTPGLFEQRANTAEVRDNTEIFSVIRQCIKQSVTRMSAILLVLKMNDKFSPENMEVLKQVSSFLGVELLEHTIMVFTNGEDCDIWDMGSLVLDFFSGDELKKFPFTSIGFSGAVDQSRVKYGKEYVTQSSATVRKLRQSLIQKIIKFEDITLPDPIIEQMALAVETSLNSSTQEETKDKEQTPIPPLISGREASSVKNSKEKPNKCLVM